MTDTVFRPDAHLGHVRLEVPAVPQMSRVARLAASGLASLSDFSIDEIEDIKIAVSEALIALIELGGGARVALELGVQDHAFRISATAAVRDLDVDHDDFVLCRTVLDGVCSWHEIDLTDGVARIDAGVARSGS